MIERNKIGREIETMLCWKSYCPECVLRDRCSRVTPEEAIDIARKNKDVFLKKFHLMNSNLGKNALRFAAFSVVVGVKMK